MLYGYSHDQSLANALQLAEEIWGEYEISEHWTQGEFHHDVVISIPDQCLIISTNCNGGVKDVLLLNEKPNQEQLWHWRCPDNPEFQGAPINIVEYIKTDAWHDPCGVLAPDARSELKPEFRKRQNGGGWEMK